MDQENEKQFETSVDPPVAEASNGPTDKYQPEAGPQAEAPIPRKKLIKLYFTIFAMTFGATTIPNFISSSQSTNDTESTIASKQLNTSVDAEKQNQAKATEEYVLSGSTKNYTDTLTGLTFTYPSEYTAESSSIPEESRICTSYISRVLFETESDDLPSVSYFFDTADSVRAMLDIRAEKTNDDIVCVDAEGTYSVDYFNDLKSAFEQNSAYTAKDSPYIKFEKPQLFNSRYWYFGSYKNSNGMSRRYVSFVNDKQVITVIYIKYYSEVTKQATDDLFAKFSIK